MLLESGLDEAAAAKQAGWRIFGAKPGAYGAGVQGAIDGRLWQSREDLAEVYLNWGGYAYGGADEGTAARGQFAQRLSQQAVLQTRTIASTTCSIPTITTNSRAACSPPWKP